MINDDLFAKFDSIEDLPISEELLGAYIEGHTDPLETLEIKSLLESDSGLSMLSESIDSFDNEIVGFMPDVDMTSDDFYPINIDAIELPSCDYFENAGWNDNNEFFSNSVSSVHDSFVHKDFLSIDSSHVSLSEDDNNYSDLSDSHQESDCNILDLD